jgi:hypothetical protein
MTYDDAIEFAERNLPPGWEILISIVDGGIEAKVYDEDGERRNVWLGHELEKVCDLVDEARFHAGLLSVQRPE